VIFFISERLRSSLSVPRRQARLSDEPLQFAQLAESIEADHFTVIAPRSVVPTIQSTENSGQM
jgi:hypothetical protein